MYKLQHLLVIRADVGTQATVVERAQRLNNAVDHGRTEDATALKYCTLLLEAVSRGSTAIGKLSEALKLILVLLEVDIYINIGAIGNLQGILHFEAVAASHCQACDKLIYFC